MISTVMVKNPVGRPPLGKRDAVLLNKALKYKQQLELESPTHAAFKVSSLQRD